jgi:nitrous oxidase accessory protein NosD
LSGLGVLAVLVVLFFLFREPILHQLARLRGTAPAPAADAQVKPGESIQAALDAASPGETVELLPGEYAGPVRLHDGVALVCRSPQRAVIRPGGGGAPGATVQAEGLRQRTLVSGIRIEAANAPRSVALALTDSNVELVDAEIVGGTEAGVVISGAAARPLLEASHIHGNRGAGVVLRDGAAPRLRANLIAGNGTVVPLHPGVEICESCLPSLVDNRFLDNGGPALRLLASGPGAAELAAQLFGWNSFASSLGVVPREKAVVAGAGTHP